jgi:ATP-dependent RNA helicase DeaD
MSEATLISSFEELHIAPPLLRAIKDVGYETPSPIQAKAIPYLLDGHDLVGQAQTGTGKTAAFAIPILQRLNLARREPQVLVLAPTRELALQVAEAFQSYARYLKDFHVLPIYGGQSMPVQLRPLRRGVHVIVGTPGRVMDHLRRGSLSLSSLKTLVLDEADEMLKMGFIDDVQWILEQTPPERQIALFSATMPDAIRRIARHHLREPKEVKIEAKTATVSTTQQQYWQVTGTHKLDALTRILETEDFDAMLVFVRTKTATAELAEKLEARGYEAAALNGDMSQASREQVISKLKKKALDIVVATDVAARGLDVDRISHVVNFDIPYDTEAYIHRIGRTGRAGREGKAILFVAPREMRMLSAIERATRHRIEKINLPTHRDIAERRIEQFKQSVLTTLESEDLDPYRRIIQDLVAENDTSALSVATALAFMSQRERPLLVEKPPEPPEPAREFERERKERKKPKYRDKDKGFSKKKRVAKAAAPSGQKKRRTKGAP